MTALDFCFNAECHNIAFSRFHGSEGRYCRKCLMRLYRGRPLQPEITAGHCPCGNLHHAKGLCRRCYGREYHSKDKATFEHRKRESGDGSRRNTSNQQPIEFIFKDRYDRETCLETLIDRGIAWQETGGRITWSEKEEQGAA